MPRHGPLALKPFLITLLYEIYDDKQGSLQMADLLALTAEYSMRLDDVVSTLIELASEGGWNYLDENGEIAVLSKGIAEGEGRLSDKELKTLTGSWSPVVVVED